jgi:class 3 adenylate cyclase
MLRKKHESSEVNESRYDVETLREVTLLAQRLQETQQETMTAAEVVAVGAEVGLAPGFVRQALALMERQRGVVEDSKTTDLEPAEGAPAWRQLAAAVAPWIWASMGYATALGFSGQWVPPVFFFLLGPIPLAYTLGRTFKERWQGLLVGSEVAITLYLAILGLMASTGSILPESVTQSLIYLLPLLGSCSLAGMAGAVLGNKSWGKLGEKSSPARRVPKPSAAMVKRLSRPVMLRLLFELQRQLEGQKEHRAVLSLEVVNPTELKKSGSELEAEYSFSQLRQWMEAIVRRAGGELDRAAGEGFLAVFPSDTAAVGAARQIQEGLAAFNREQNRLSRPVRLRSGLAAGDLAAGGGVPLASLHSLVIDRAIALQRAAEPGDILVGSELAGPGITELGALSKLPEPVEGEPAFSWRHVPG